MMKSVVIAMMVATMMILQTAAYPGYPGPTPESKVDTTTEEPPTETPTSSPAETPTSSPIWTLPADCPDLSSSCIGECVYHVDYSSGQCPTCDCPYPFCTDETCSPDEQCVENSECPDGICHYCFPIIIAIEPTTETPTWPPTSTSTVTTPPPCPDTSWCTDDCYLDYNSEECLNCICPTTLCEVVTCVSSEECYPGGPNQNHECLEGRCYACNFRDHIPWRPTTSTTTATPTTSCPPYPVYVRNPGCAAFFDSDGCITARCFTCDDIPPCDEGTTCELQICSTFPCPPPVICVSTTEPTTETTTWSYTWTTTPPPCPDVSWCPSDCQLEYSSDGCPNCSCYYMFCQVATCFSSQCHPSSECYGGRCYSCYYIEPPTLTPSTWTTTPPPCPDVSFCPADCQLEYNSAGCPNCSCYYMFCQVVSCFSSQECDVNNECYGGRCYSCYYIDHTPSPPTPPTTAPCSSTSCDSSPLCSIDYSSGDCACVCVDPECMLEGCPPGQACLPNGDCDTCYSCLPDGTTTETTTVTTTTWTTINCWTSTCGLYCAFGNKLGSNGCPACDCNPEDACLFQFQPFGCPDGYECVPTRTYCNKDTCFYEPSCSPKNETTPSPTTTPRCVSDFSCPEECNVTQDSDGCPQCVCSSPCELVDCQDGYFCKEEVYPCFVAPCPTHAVCVPINTTTSPTPCPMVTCVPDCVSDTGSDGCTTCECPPSCKTVKCSAGHECQLVNVTCFRYPCFPQPQCVPVEDPCTGTPNPGRCGRGSKTRWTYNSLTNKCESFRYYGCTPSPNTFRSRKECRKECNGNSQINCPDLVCAEDSCYTLERKDECPLCICPNPCKEFHCRKGYECKMRESKCKKGAKPYCAKMPCPPADPCAIRCMYGLKTDEDGCQLCDCLEEPRSYP